MILVIAIILSSRYYPLFEEVGTEFVIRTGNILYMQGDRSSNLYLVKSGRVRMFYIGENGKESIQTNPAYVRQHFLSLKSHDFGFFLVSDMLHSTSVFNFQGAVHR